MENHVVVFLSSSIMRPFWRMGGYWFPIIRHGVYGGWCPLLVIYYSQWLWWFKGVNRSKKTVKRQAFIVRIPPFDLWPCLLPFPTCLSQTIVSIRDDDDVATRHLRPWPMALNLNILSKWMASTDLMNGDFYSILLLINNGTNIIFIRVLSWLILQT